MQPNPVESNLSVCIDEVQIAACDLATEHRILVTSWLRNLTG